jgi:hypothetical protein
MVTKEAMKRILVRGIVSRRHRCKQYIFCPLLKYIEAYFIQHITGVPYMNVPLLSSLNVHEKYLNPTPVNSAGIPVVQDQ